MTRPTPHTITALAGTVSRRYRRVLLDSHEYPRHTLHVWGPTRSQREDAIADARLLVRVPHDVRHHWHVETRSALRSVYLMPEPTPAESRRAKQLARVSNLATIAAAAFVLGVVIYNVAAA